MSKKDHAQHRRDFPIPNIYRLTFFKKTVKRSCIKSSHIFFLNVKSRGQIFYLNRPNELLLLNLCAILNNKTLERESHCKVCITLRLLRMSAAWLLLTFPARADVVVGIWLHAAGWWSASCWIDAHVFIICVITLVVSINKYLSQPPGLWLLGPKLEVVALSHYLVFTVLIIDVFCKHPSFIPMKVCCTRRFIISMSWSNNKCWSFIIEDRTCSEQSLAYSLPNLLWSNRRQSNQKHIIL